MTNCSSLTKVYLSGKQKLKLPSCIKNVSGVNYSTPTFVSGTELTYIEIFGGPDFDNILKALKNVKSVNTIDGQYCAHTSSLGLLTNLNVKEVYIQLAGTDANVNADGFVMPATIEKFSLKDYKSSGIVREVKNMPTSILSPSGTALTSFTWQYTDLSDFSFLSDFNLLTDINISYNAMTDISFSGQKLTALNNLDLRGNKIAGLKGIDTFKSIKKLVLNSNLLTDTSAYYDENNQTVIYNNLEEIVKINYQRRRTFGKNLY